MTTAISTRRRTHPATTPRFRPVARATASSTAPPQPRGLPPVDRRDVPVAGVACHTHGTFGRVSSAGGKARAPPELRGIFPVDRLDHHRSAAWTRFRPHPRHGRNLHASPVRELGQFEVAAGRASRRAQEDTGASDNQVIVTATQRAGRCSGLDYLRRDRRGRVAFPATGRCGLPLARSPPAARGARWRLLGPPWRAAAAT